MMGNLEHNAMTEAEADDAIFENDVIIENNAVVTIDHENKRLVVLFDGDRNAVMEYRNEEELAISEAVLADPNFWANFLSTFSAALNNTTGVTIEQE